MVMVVVRGERGGGGLKKSCNRREKRHGAREGGREGEKPGTKTVQSIGH